MHVVKFACGPTLAGWRKYVHSPVAALRHHGGWVVARRAIVDDLDLRQPLPRRTAARHSPASRARNCAQL